MPLKSKPVNCNPGKRAIKIRDSMDEILESQGYYRKHVAEGPDSIFRATSDFLFGTQAHKDVIKQTHRLFKLDVDDVAQMHPIPSVLAGVLNVKFEIIQFKSNNLGCYQVKPTSIRGIVQTSEHSSDSSCANWSRNSSSQSSPERRRDGARRKGSREKRRKRMKIQLCFTPPHQYDPIYTQLHVGHAGFVQSVIYRMMYEEVFKVKDASQAAELMLGPCDSFSLAGKPDRYDKEFRGTAMEALEHFLIPFPYKVAKALHPDSYRNIEFDVWVMETKAALGRKHPHGNGIERAPTAPPVTIGKLPINTPCLVRFDDGQDVFGYNMGLAADRRHVQIYIPDMNDSVFALREAVRPLKSPLPTRSELSQCPTQQPGLDSSYPCPVEPSRCPDGFGSLEENCAAIRTIQGNNILTLASGDPEWQTKFDFCVPPPHSSDFSPAVHYPTPGEEAFSRSSVQTPVATPLPSPAICWPFHISLVSSYWNVETTTPFAVPLSAHVPPATPAGLIFQFPSPLSTPLLTPQTPLGGVQQVFEFSDLELSESAHFNKPSSIKPQD